MRRTRLSELRPWAVKLPLLARAFAALMVLGFPLLVIGLLVIGCLQAVGRELKTAWADRHDIAELDKELFACAFMPWENDLK